MNQNSLEHLRQIKLAGGSSRVLNNLITSELKFIGETPQWTAFCNVNGKVITTSWITKNEDGFSLSCDVSLVEALIKHIQHHALRHQFNIEINDTPTLPGDINHIDAAIKHHYPIVTEDTTEQFIPQMLNLHHHKDAINFDKGCYLGQEIIMRAKQLGKVKRSLHFGTINQALKQCEVTDQDNKVCGKVINVSDQAPFIFNFVANTHHQTLRVDDTEVSLLSG